MLIRFFKEKYDKVVGLRNKRRRCDVAIFEITKGFHKKYFTKINPDSNKHIFIETPLTSDKDISIKNIHNIQKQYRE